MLLKLARAYVHLVLIVETALVLMLLIVHVTTLLGVFNPFARHYDTLLVGTLLTQFPTVMLAKERNVWKNEFKDCPWWLRDLVVASFLYGLLMIVLGASTRFKEGAMFPISTSAFFMGFAIMGLCVTSSTLWSGSPTESELIKRAGNSLIAVVVVVAFLLIPNHIRPSHLQR